MIALRYPYILAFEPTFVEIRNIETGSMVQVIQGNNLQSLYADVPSFLRQTHSRSLGSSFPSSSARAFAHGTLSEADEETLVAPYPGQPPTPHGRMVGREEMIIVSDDRVLTLRMATAPRE
jgi:RHO1 GDP-GTP exchange protein 1/2